MTNEQHRKPSDLLLLTVEASLTSYEHDDDGKALFTIRIGTRERFDSIINGAREGESLMSNLTLPNPTDVSEEKVK